MPVVMDRLAYEHARLSTAAPATHHMNRAGAGRAGVKVSIGAVDRLHIGVRVGGAPVGAERRPEVVVVPAYVFCGARLAAVDAAAAGGAAVGADAARPWRRCRRGRRLHRRQLTFDAFVVGGGRRKLRRGPVRGAIQSRGERAQLAVDLDVFVVAREAASAVESAATAARAAGAATQRCGCGLASRRVTPAGVACVGSACVGRGRWSRAGCRC